MAWHTGWFSAWFALAGVLFAAVVGCGGDDAENDEAGRYFGVVEWECSDVESTRCVCQGSEGAAGGASRPAVEECSLPICKSFLVEEEWWVCECRDEEFDPKENAVDAISQVESVLTCPPS